MHGARSVLNAIYRAVNMWYACPKTRRQICKEFTQEKEELKGCEYKPDLALFRLLKKR